MEDYRNVQSVTLGNIASFPGAAARVYAIEPNYLDVVYPEYTIVAASAEEKGNGRASSVARGLYDAPDTITTGWNPLGHSRVLPALTCTAALSYNGLSAEDPALLEVEAGNGEITKYEINTYAMISKMAGIMFRSYQSAASYCPALVSYNTFLWIREQGENRTKGRPITDYSKKQGIVVILSSKLYIS